MLEKDFYTVEAHDGGKVIHMLAFTEDRDDHCTIVEPAFAYCGVDERPEDLTFPERTHYEWDATEEEVEKATLTYFDGEPGTHLPLFEVNQDTPCGEYWCYLYEETKE